ncbi:hypothetical protein D3C83_331930 [compost metagenome]
MSLPGEVGTDVSPDGAFGGVESSVYVKPVVEHGEILPAGSVAVAKIVVAASFGSVTGIE